MTPKIKQLAEKAHLHVFINPDGSLPPELAKFAELIVQACADIADNTPSVLIGKTTGDLIKEHFGVHAMNYRVLEHDAEHNIVYLEDISGPTERTITNDAERVMRDMFRDYGSRVLIVYRDTNNEWWQMRLKISGPYDEHEDIVFEPWNGLAWDILKRK